MSYETTLREFLGVAHNKSAPDICDNLLAWKCRYLVEEVAIAKNPSKPAMRTSTPATLEQGQAPGGPINRSAGVQIDTTRLLIPSAPPFFAGMANIAKENPFTQTVVDAADGTITTAKGNHSFDGNVSTITPSPVICQLFLSVGQTRTQLHRDIYDNIYCCLHGQRQWVVAHAGHKEYVEAEPGSVSAAYQPRWDIWSNSLEREKEMVAVEPGQESEAGIVPPGRSYTTKFKLFQEVRFVSVLLSPGDGIFMPSGFWHAVEAKGTSSSAVNWYFDVCVQ